MESEHESESNKHLSKDAINSRNKDDAFPPIISVKKSDHGSESEADKDINYNEKTSGSAEKSNSSHSASSSSESSSDFFQIDITGDMSSKSEDLNEKSLLDVSSQVSHATNESTLQMESLFQAPLIQVMEKTGGYDPNRIPDSVFGRSSSAMDWSVASNESLFSIHLGNNSFSREQFLMMSGELYNSGELNKPDEKVKSGRPPLSPIGKLQKEKAEDSDKKLEQTEAADETMEDSSERDVFDQLEEETEVEVNGHSSMINRPSDASGTSTQSFAFPILVDTIKSDSVKGPSPWQQDINRVVHEDNPKMKAHTKSLGCCCCYNCCSLPHWPCPSYQHCWSWNKCKKWFCC